MHLSVQIKGIHINSTVLVAYKSKFFLVDLYKLQGVKAH